MPASELKITGASGSKRVRNPDGDGLVAEAAAIAVDIEGLEAENVEEALEELAGGAGESPFYLRPEDFPGGEDARWASMISAAPANGATISLSKGGNYTLTSPLNVSLTNAVRIVGNRATITFVIPGVDVERCIDARRSVDFSLSDVNIVATGTDLGTTGILVDASGSDATSPMFRFNAERVKTSITTGRHFYFSGSIGAVLTDVSTYGGTVAYYGIDVIDPVADFASAFTFTNCISVGLVAGGFQFYNWGNQWQIINSFPTPDANHSGCWIGQGAAVSAFGVVVQGGTLNDDLNDDRYWIDLEGANLGLTITGALLYASNGAQLLRTTGSMQGLDISGCGLYGGTPGVDGKQQIRLEGTNISCRIANNVDGTSSGVYLNPSTSYGCDVGPNYLGDRPAYYNSYKGGKLDPDTGLPFKPADYIWGLYSLGVEAPAPDYPGRYVVTTDGYAGDPGLVFSDGVAWLKASDGSGASIFDYTTLATSIAAFDPSVTASVTLNAGNISALGDLTGTGNDLAQATVGAQPLLIADDGRGNAVIQGASGDYIQRATWVGGEITPNVLYCAGTWASGSSGVMFDGGNGSASQGLANTSGHPDAYDGLSGLPITATVIAAGTPFICRMKWNVDLSINAYFETPTADYTATLTAGATGINGLTLGSLYTGGFSYIGTIGFWQIAGTVSDDDDARMLAMLRDRFLPV